ILHFPVVIACMIWLFAWHRDAYPRTRTTLVLFTGVCLLIQFVPVAPPRMLPLTGMVDTAVRYHQSVYSSVAGFRADQLSAMPSVHVGWAALVAVAVIVTARSRWRWLAVLYPAMTTLAVVVTANHFWLDGIVAVGLLGLLLAGQAAARIAGRAVAGGAVLSRAVLGRAMNSGLYPTRLTWHDPGNTHPRGTRGAHGDISSGTSESRPAAKRDRPA
ncbi:MAG: phosphatase PAP2 family protein, partial [Streptosporangiaceae bacterium]